MTSCEDDPADGLDLPDDAGNSGGGQEAVVTDHQTADLRRADVEQKQCQQHIKSRLSPVLIMFF